MASLAVVVYFFQSTINHYTVVLVDYLFKDVKKEEIIQCMQSQLSKNKQESNLEIRIACTTKISRLEKLKKNLENGSYLEQQALKLIKQDSFSQAERTIQADILENTKHLETKYFNLAVVYHLQSKYGHAINAYKKVTRIKPDDYEAYMGEGLAHASMGDLDTAIELYQDAIDIKSDYYEAYNNMGVAHAKLGGRNNLDKAIKKYQRAIMINPNRYEAYINIKNAYISINQLENAVGAYQKAIDTGFKNYQTYIDIGTLYNKLKQYPEDIESYKNALKIKPNGYEAHINKGITYIRSEQYQNAIKVLKKAIRINPNISAGHLNIGLAYKKLEHYQQAIEAYTKAVELDPELTKHSKQYNWNALETWVNTLTDSKKQQRYQSTLRQLKGE